MKWECESYIRSLEARAMDKHDKADSSVVCRIARLGGRGNPLYIPSSDVRMDTPPL